MSAEGSLGQVLHFRLPDVGEGLTEADILQWHVGVGDVVAVNQIIVEIETAKAAVELPSPYAGVITELLAGEGDTVDVGAPIVAIEVAPEGSGPGSSAAAAPAAERATESEIPPMLVGYGPRAGHGPRRVRHGDQAARAAAPASPAAATPAAAAPDLSVAAAPDSSIAAAPDSSVAPAAQPPPGPVPARSEVLAKPPVRKLAKSLGVELADLEGTGPNGTVTREDVQQAAAMISAAPTPVRPSRPARPEELEEHIPVRGVRRQTATAMVSSAFKAPHVSVFQTIDMSATMALRETVAGRREFHGLRITPLLFVSRAVLLALRRHPYLNASWLDEPNEIVIKRYVNLGFAAATDRGLIVPNIKDADQLSLVDLARSIEELTLTARAGRATVADLTGGTFTITNIGVFGIDSGTPILTPGEAAILAFGAVRRQPWVVTRQDGSEAIEPRWVTQLSLSFDHRVVDGEQGARFLADVAEILTEPALSVL